MALIFDPQPSPKCSCTQLIREQLLLVAPRHLVLPARVSPAALTNFPMVLPSSPYAIRGFIDAALRPKSIELRLVIEVGAVNAVLPTVGSDVDCTILPESATALDLHRDQLACAPIGPPSLWNMLVLAELLARSAIRLTRGTSQLLRELDFHASRPAH